MRIYLDTAPLIYLVENVPPYVSAIADRLAVPGTIQVCSELSRLECRVKPIRDRETALLAAFDNYFANIADEILPLTRQIVEVATDLRAHYGYRIPDAIHLAAAVVDRCDLFLTNDQQLVKCTEIPVEIVET